jgi:hypothetical protein
MDKNQIILMYEVIQDYQPDQIRSLVADKLRKKNCLRNEPENIGICYKIVESVLAFFTPQIFAASCCPSPPDPDIEYPTPEELEEVCKESIKENSFSIKQILKKHPNYTNCIIDIITLLAPAIAQQYIGIPGIAIVGTITVICKQGIHTYLE